MSNERKQPHFTEWVWESTEQNVAIPPQSSSDVNLKPKPAQPAKDNRQQPADKDKQALEAAVQLQFWDTETQEPVTTTESQFVKRAKELEHFKEAAALFVPFKSYWPTYGHMTGTQSRWYFFWRDEVRQGRYPKTDLSYIFLHVYELINGVGWVEPIEGYRQLCLLWEAYRDKYKRLDQYFGGWITDFSFVHHLDIPLSVIVARSRGLAGDLAELELMRCLSGATDQLTFTVLTVMSDYDISKSKFYSGIGQEAAELYIPKVVALIDAYITRKHGKNLVQMFPPGPPVLRERYLFRSAVYDISLYGYSVLVPVVRISKSPQLRSLITRLFRLTENKLRELMGFRGRLKDIKMDADMEDLVSQFLKRELRKAEQEERGPAVIIDPEKLERLQADSEVVRTLLTVQDLGYTEDIYETSEPRGIEGTAIVLIETSDDVKTEAVTIEDDNNAPDIEVDEAALHDSGSGSEWEQFAAALTSLQREAVLALAEGKGWIGLQKLASASGAMAELLIDEINDMAMDLLGDLLIDGEEVTAEYVPMLSYLKR